MPRWITLALIGSVVASMLLFTASCSTPVPAEPENPATEFSNPSDIPAATIPEPGLVDSPEKSSVTRKVASLTLEQKIAQMFIVTPEAITGVDTATQAGSATQQALQENPVGGLVYFQKNLQDADQTKEMLSNSQSYAQDASGLPLFTCVDEEGGTVSRVGGNPGFDIPNVGNMANIGATGDPEQAQEVARNIGAYLHDLGFNVDFAPDADICGDPASDVMALRSFSSDPEIVAGMVAAQVTGFSEANVLCSAKHFPGIGGLRGDSHDGQIITPKTLDELRAFELIPFRAAIEAQIPLIMVGHLSAPQAIGSDIPASLSRSFITDLLRIELGYQNLIITDSMSMGALEGFTTPERVGVDAILAGVDVVLMPPDYHAAYQGILDAVSSGEIPVERIGESVTRIVRAKLEL